MFDWKTKDSFIKICAKFIGTTSGLLLVIMLATIVNAQFNAAFQGVVTDSAGGVISGATATLTNKETGRSQKSVTGDNGFYRFSGLAPGSYSLTVEQANFKKQSIENIDVAAEITQGIDVTLEAGGISEVVTVTDTSTTLDTENANVQKAIGTEEIRRLPQNGRDPFELLRLTPGVFGDSGRGGNGNAVNLPNTPGPGGSNNSIFQSENVPQISAAGQRVTANNYQLDGVSINSLQQGGASVITPNQESVKEIVVSSSSFSAEDGRNSGAQVRAVSQNGTNQFHGSAFFKYNAPELNAFNKFYGIPGSTIVPPQRVENRYKTYGASLGGPIILPHFGEGGPYVYNGKNKLFFFLSYEGLRNNSNDTYRAFVETAQYRQQVIALRPNSTTARVFQSSGIEPRIAAILPQQTCAQVFGGDAINRCRDVAGGLDLGSITGTRNVYLPLGNGIGNANIGGGFDGVPDVVYALLNQPTQRRGKQYNARVDYNLNSKNQIAFTSYVTKQQDLSVDPGSQSRTGSDVFIKPVPYVLTGIWLSNLTSNLFNEFRTNFTSFHDDEVKSSTNTNFGIPNVQIEGVPFNQIRFGRSRSETTPAIFSQKTLEFADSLTTVLGNHAVKFGGSFRREFNNNELSGGSRPLYSFVGLFNLANDTPIFEAINANPTSGAPASAKRELRSNDISFFVQDDWKVRPNLTLNLGLRYEYFSPLTDVGNRLTNLQLGTGAQTLSAAKLVSVKSLNDPDKNNFGPRVGFAYSPKFSNLFGSNFAEKLENKLVIRGGGGIYYNRIPSVVFANAAGNPPNFARYNICCGVLPGEFGPDPNNTPFSAGRILYSLGSDNSTNGYPFNPALATGINPTTGLPNPFRNPLTGELTPISVEVYGSPRRVPNAEVYKYALGLEYQLPYKIVTAIGYEGNQSRNLIRLVNQNFLYTANPGIFAAYFASPDVNASYNGMNLRVERRFANNVQVAANYRFSKSLDTLSNEGPGAQTNQTYPVDLRQERGLSDYDVRHLFNLSGIADLPFFKNQKTLAGKLLGGFELSGILTYHTGFPWTPKVNTQIRGAGGDFFGPVRPVGYLGGVQQNTSNSSFLQPNGYFTGGAARYFNATLNRDPTRNNDFTFQANPPGIGRNTFRGPNYFDIDMSVAKRFGLPGLGFLGEGRSLELKANFFNLFNRLNLAPFGFFSNGTIVAFGDPANPTYNPQFGVPDGALSGRQVELQARFRF